MISVPPKAGKIMSQNYRIAQPGIVKTTTSHDSINISFKRGDTAQTKITVKHTAVEQKHVNQSSCQVKCI